MGGQIDLAEGQLTPGSRCTVEAPFRDYREVRVMKNLQTISDYIIMKCPSISFKTMLLVPLVVYRNSFLPLNDNLTWVVFIQLINLIS